MHWPRVNDGFAVEVMWRLNCNRRMCELYHSNVTNLIHFHFHSHFTVSWSCFGHQASILRRHYISSFWCELRALVAFGWLQAVGWLAYWAWGELCSVSVGMVLFHIILFFFPLTSTIKSHAIYYCYSCYLFFMLIVVGKSLKHSFIHSFIHFIGMCKMQWFLAILRSFFHSSLSSLLFLPLFSANYSSIHPHFILPSISWSSSWSSWSH
jgi:hypothetical protein